MAGLADFLSFAMGYHKDVWICTREQIADFWHENHYPMGAGSPLKTISKGEETPNEVVKKQESQEKGTDESETGDVI